MNTFVILLRGINVGGNKKVPMSDFKTLLESLGCTKVKTVLNSGNAVVDSNEVAAVLRTQIEAAILQKFGFEVATQVMDFEKIQKALQSDPFKKIPEEKGLHCYVTFLGTNAKPGTLEDADGNFKVIAQSPDFLFTTVDTTSKATVDLMAVLDKQFGKQVTTRNWRTLEKIVNVSS